MSTPEATSAPHFLQIDLDLPRDRALDAAIALDTGRPFDDLLGYYELLYDEAHPLHDRGRIILYFPAEAEQIELRVELLLVALDIDDYILSQTRLDREDYQNSYKQYFQPVAVDERLAIVPEWHRETNESKALLVDGRRALYLDPGMAFGTGNHATTRLCLRALGRHLTPGRPASGQPALDRRIVDAGCGSGVLSIGAVLLGATSVFAFDIEENAIQASRHNFTLNADCPERIELVRGGFELASLAPAMEQADLVVANLTAQVLADHAEALGRGSHRRLLLSGVWREHRERVEIAFLENGPGALWQADRIDEEEGWLLFDLIRK